MGFFCYPRSAFMVSCLNFDSIKNYLQVMNAQAGPSKPEKENDGEVDDEEVVAEEAVDGLTGLSDLQLLEVFKQTSIFNVRSAMGGNEVLMGGDPESRTENEQYWSDDDWSDDEADWDTLKGFWSDEEDDDAFQRKVISQASVPRAVN